MSAIASNAEASGSANGRIGEDSRNGWNIEQTGATNLEEDPDHPLMFLNQDNRDWAKHGFSNNELPPLALDANGNVKGLPTSPEKTRQMTPPEEDIPRDRFQEFFLRSANSNPEVSQEIMTPTQQLELLRSWKELHDLNLRRAINCPQRNCRKVFHPLDFNGLEKHYREEHTLRNCSTCKENIDRLKALEESHHQQRAVEVAQSLPHSDCGSNLEVAGVLDFLFKRPRSPQLPPPENRKSLGPRLDALIKDFRIPVTIMDLDKELNLPEGETHPEFASRFTNSRPFSMQVEKASPEKLNYLRWVLKTLCGFDDWNLVIRSMLTLGGHKDIGAPVLAELAGKLCEIALQLSASGQKELAEHFLLGLMHWKPLYSDHQRKQLTNELTPILEQHTADARERAKEYGDRLVVRVWNKHVLLLPFVGQFGTDLPPNATQSSIELGIERRTDSLSQLYWLKSSPGVFDKSTLQKKQVDEVDSDDDSHAADIEELEYDLKRYETPITLKELDRVLSMYNGKRSGALTLRGFEMTRSDDEHTLQLQRSVLQTTCGYRAWELIIRAMHTFRGNTMDAELVRACKLELYIAEKLDYLYSSEFAEHFLLGPMHTQPLSPRHWADLIECVTTIIDKWGLTELPEKPITSDERRSLTVGRWKQFPDFDDHQPQDDQDEAEDSDEYSDLSDFSTSEWPDADPVAPPSSVSPASAAKGKSPRKRLRDDDGTYRYASDEDSADDLEPDVNDLTPRKRVRFHKSAAKVPEEDREDRPTLKSSKLKRKFRKPVAKNLDGTYRYASDEDSADELQPDVDDLTPPKRHNIKDPTNKPSQDEPVEEPAEELAEGAVIAEETAPKRPSPKTKGKGSSAKQTPKKTVTKPSLAKVTKTPPKGKAAKKTTAAKKTDTAAAKKAAPETEITPEKEKTTPEETTSATKKIPAPKEAAPKKAARKKTVPPPTTRVTRAAAKAAAEAAK